MLPGHACLLSSLPASEPTVNDWILNTSGRNIALELTVEGSRRCCNIRWRYLCPYVHQRIWDRHLPGIMDNNLARGVSRTTGDSLSVTSCSPSSCHNQAIRFQLRWSPTQKLDVWNKRWTIYGDKGMDRYKVWRRLPRYIIEIQKNFIKEDDSLRSKTRHSRRHAGIPSFFRAWASCRAPLS